MSSPGSLTVLKVTVVNKNMQLSGAPFGRIVISTHCCHYLAYPDGRVAETKLRHCNTSEGNTKVVQTFRSVVV